MEEGNKTLMSQTESHSLNEFLNLFIEDINNIHKKSMNQQINTLIADNKITTEKMQNDIYIQKSSAEVFISNIISFEFIMCELGISFVTLKKHIKKYNIPFYSFGYSPDTFFLEESNYNEFIFNEKYISIVTVFKILKIPYIASTARNMIIKLEQDKRNAEIIGFEKLKVPMYFRDKTMSTPHVFNHNSVIQFKENYVNFEEISRNLGIEKQRLHSSLTYKKIKSYQFLLNYNLRFITINDYYQYKNYRNTIDNDSSTVQTLVNNKIYIKMLQENQTYSGADVRKALQLRTVLRTMEVLDEQNIKPLHTFKTKSGTFNFYEKKHIDQLLKFQKEMYLNYSEKYCTSLQLRRNYDDSYIFTLLYTNPNLRIDCPLILRPLFQSPNLYKKQEVDEILKAKNEVQDMRNIKLENPFEEFQYKMNYVMELKFPEFLSKTENLWYQFVKSKVFNSNKKDFDHNLVNQLVKTTDVIIRKLDKEIYLYSPVGLNRLLLNPNSTEINKVTMTHIYDFLKNLIQKLLDETENFFLDLEKINNPRHFLKTQRTDNTRYKYEEYKTFFKYAVDLNIHKKKAINDAKSFIKGSKYLKYDSYWIYVLTHLTNNWRHGTIVTELPQVSLSNTSVTGLDWLLDNDITLEDANTIIFQIGITLKKVAKTEADTQFRISEPLKVAFATAVIICQLKVNTMGSNNNKRLLNLHEKNTICPHHRVYQSFFQDLDKNIVFSNRKMNKTLSTLIWSVFKNSDNVKVSRAHSDINSTLKYIKLDDSQVEDLSSLLFNNDSFGFMNNLLVDTIFEKNDNLNSLMNNKQSIVFKDKYGDVQKIEISLGLVNKLAKDYSDSITIVNQLTDEEKLGIVTGSLKNTLFSKQRYYQCIFSECKFSSQPLDTIDCMTCPYSITNVYALSNLMSMYLDKISQLINVFPNAKIGEKQRLANQFYLLWKEIQMAKQKYGQSIYEFVEGGKERFELLSKLLPETKNHITLSIEDV